MLEVHIEADLGSFTQANKVRAIPHHEPTHRAVRALSDAQFDMPRLLLLPLQKSLEDQLALLIHKSSQEGATEVQIQRLYQGPSAHQ